MTQGTEIDRLVVNTIKGLAMDAVQEANSGHPGMPMGTADIAYVLWHRFLKHDPSDPGWPDRDRFVLSAGHGSMLLYSLLHLTGYGLPLSEIKRFRQWGSKTPGHPEVGHTVGVETTTGPLGQGFANGVGMALAEAMLRARFGAELCDHRVFGIVSDGDLMEGVAAEAASLAGHLGLGRIVYLYDDNQITIDGGTDLSFTEDTAKRFESYGWHVQSIDGHDHEAIAAAIQAAVDDDARPSLICCRTVIGQGSPNKEGKSSSHGSPLGEDELRLTKQGLGMDPDARFVVPDEVLAHLRGGNKARAEARVSWKVRLDESPKRSAWAAQHAPVNAESVIWPSFEAGASVATRKASAAALNAAAAAIPALVGGSADLAGSNGAGIKGGGAVQPGAFTGRDIFFGVREHAMGSICNGMTLHGGFLPYCATFLVFHDYMRPAVRLAGLMNQPVICVYTHDSIFVGEDGPTHQPVEHLMALRLIPNLVTLRPADANETVEAWKVAVERSDGPTALVLTRQGLPVLDQARYGAASGLSQGAYVLSDCEGAPEVVLIGTGSEVDLALKAQGALAAQGVAARVVSMPSWELFSAASPEHRASVLPAGVPRVSVEAGRTMGWERWVGFEGASVGIDTFGASAPAEVLAEKFGFTVDNVVATVNRVLGR